MFEEAIEDLTRLRLAPDKSLANIRKMQLNDEEHKLIMQATRIVRFPEFYKQAVRIFAAVADAMKTLKKKTVLFTREKKSNEWMGVLFLDFLRRSGNADLIPSVRFSYNVETKDSIVVFFDDGSYSGDQMAVDYLKRFLWNIEQSVVIVGIPFVTKIALRNIRRALDNHASRLSSMILYSDIMTPAANAITTPYDKKQIRLYKPAIYFNHKIPDYHSTYRLYDKYFDQNKVEPIYKERSVMRVWYEDSERKDFNVSEYIKDLARLPTALSIVIDHDPSLEPPEEE